jgi:nicotinate-nucleotide pyrophosphorylase (carboxylating)
MEIDKKRLQLLINLAIEEDLKDIGDATSISVIPETTKVKGLFITKEDCVLAGLPVIKAVFKTIDPTIEFKTEYKDGDKVPTGVNIAEIYGNAEKILTAERTALNFLQRLCGIATISSKYSEIVKNYPTVILDTRKTTPGWRNLEKYAVSVGGATNHRIGLFDRIMIKDNHRVLAGLEGADGIMRSVQRAREKFPQLEVEVEADTIEDVKEALAAKADYILLDNMTNEEMAKAVKLNNNISKFEASGGITIERIASIAEVGVDFISVGALTHSVKAIDISLDISEG